MGGSFIPLPDYLVRKNGLINIRNSDHLCFIWCVLLGLHIKLTGDEKGTHLRNPATFHKYLKYFNFSNIHFPVDVVEIPIFEKNNQASINVFRFTKDRSIIPEYITPTLRSFHVNLLLISQNDDRKQHYVFINNLSNLLGKMGSKAKFSMFKRIF